MVLGGGVWVFSWTISVDTFAALCSSVLYPPAYLAPTGDPFAWTSRICPTGLLSALVNEDFAKEIMGMVSDCIDHHVPNIFCIVLVFLIPIEMHLITYVLHMFQYFIWVEIY